MHSRRYHNNGCMWQFINVSGSACSLYMYLVYKVVELYDIHVILVHVYYIMCTCNCGFRILLNSCQSTCAYSICMYLYLCTCCQGHVHVLTHLKMFMVIRQVYTILMTNRVIYEECRPSLFMHYTCTFKANCVKILCSCVGVSVHPHRFPQASMWRL